MANDRVNQLYYGEILSKPSQDACRDRVHWMCANVSGEHVLDLGCSQGIASLLLARDGHQVVGVDIDPGAIEFARNELLKESEAVRRRVRFELIEAGRLPFEDASFDSVLLGEVIEHLARPERVIAEALRVLRPNGRIVLTTPFGVMPHPDHLQTFYLGNFLDMVRPLLRPIRLEIRTRYICMVGVRSSDDVRAEDGVLDPDRLLRLSEEVFAVAERRYLARETAAGEREKKLTGDAAAATNRMCEAVLAAVQTAREALASAPERLPAVRPIQEFLAGPAPVDAKAASAGIRLLARAARDLAAHAADVAQERSREVNRLGEELAAAQGELQLVREECARQKTQIQRISAELHRRNERVRTLTARNETRQREVEAELAKLRAQLRERDSLHHDSRVMQNLLQSRLRRQKDQLDWFRTELARRDGEVRYRLGDALVRAYYHPAELFSLPARAVRLLREGRRRAKEREHFDASERAALMPAAAPPRAPIAAETPTPAVPDAPTVAAASTNGVAATPISFKPPPRPMQPPRLSLAVASIMDEFTEECFRDECHLIPVGKKDFRQVIDSDPPHMLFVESCWKGNDGEWKLQYPDNPALKDLVAYCKSRRIPTVFWNKEDPPNFDRFVGAASLFDHIFTTDADCVPRYRERVGHDRVHALPFAAQPAIHNPIDSTRPRIGNLCFAGTYYQEKYPERRRELDLLLAAAATRGLTIFDRQAGYSAGTRLYSFPEAYQSMVRGGLSYVEMLAAYKAYHVFLNVNSVRESPTMFSRRVLELLACGTAVVSTPSRAMELMLGRDAVAIVESEQEAAEWLDRLLGDAALRERMILNGQRRVLCEHTYERRLQTVLNAVGLDFPAEKRRVSVVTVTNRPQNLESVIANYQRQQYADKELVVVLNSDSFDVAKVRDRLEQVPGARLLARPEGHTLGACLNHAVDQCQTEFVAKFDDDDYYGPFYLTDMLNAFLYCGTDIVGKHTYHAYLESTGNLVVRFPDCEHRYATLVAGATLVVRRSLLNDLRFEESVERGVDTCFLRSAADMGVRIYAADRFNFVANRSKSPDGHTWRITDEEFLQGARHVAQVQDYASLVAV